MNESGDSGGPAEGGALAKADRRLALWIALVAFVCFSGFNRGFFQSSDEVGIFETTRAIYERGALSVPDGFHVFEGRGGRSYNHFAIGQSLLALPFYAVGNGLEALLPEAWAADLAGWPLVDPPLEYGGRVAHFTVGFYAPLATGALLALFYAFERRLGVSVRRAFVATLIVGFSSYVGGMATYFLRHTSEAVCVLGGLYGFHVYGVSGSRRALAFGAALASLTLLIRVPAAFAGPGLAAYLAAALWRRRERDSLPSLALPILLPLAAVLAVHVGVNWWKWERWIGSPMLDQRSGLTFPLARGLEGLLVSPGAGLFFYTPVLLLAPWMLRALWRRDAVLCAVALSTSLLLLYIGARFDLWHGLWSAPGPRYVFLAVPLLLLALGPWLEERPGRPLLAALALLTLAGVFVQLGMLLTWLSEVVVTLQLPRDDPNMSFLFEWDKSLIWGSWVAVTSGYADTWLINLGNGFFEKPGKPLLASVLALGWGLALAACVAGMLRALRRAEPQRGTR